eukprot:GHVN01031186.1.p1 GENE.GHVN01031186.1~~GHVN01031186.1.p1  ORF type:complete len:144 (-),score=11.44 GHVN01031186.1:3-434(-)
MNLSNTSTNCAPRPSRSVWWCPCYSNPAKLPAAIRMLFELGVSQVKVPGVEVVPIPMFKRIDGSDSSFYRSGVEPSAKGNEQLAYGYYDAVFKPFNECFDWSLEKESMKSSDSWQDDTEGFRNVSMGLKGNNFVCSDDYGGHC